MYSALFLVTSATHVYELPTIDSVTKCVNRKDFYIKTGCCTEDEASAPLWANLSCQTGLIQFDGENNFGKAFYQFDENGDSYKADFSFGNLSDVTAHVRFENEMPSYSVQRSADNPNVLLGYPGTLNYGISKVNYHQKALVFNVTETGIRMTYDLGFPLFEYQLIQTDPTLTMFKKFYPERIQNGLDAMTGESHFIWMDAPCRYAKNMTFDDGTTHDTVFMECVRA